MVRGKWQPLSLLSFRSILEWTVVIARSIEINYRHRERRFGNAASFNLHGNCRMYIFPMGESWLKEVEKLMHKCLVSLIIKQISELDLSISILVTLR